MHFTKDRWNPMPAQTLTQAIGKNRCFQFARHILESSRCIVFFVTPKIYSFRLHCKGFCGA